ncbi:MAG: mandelate racemase [Myxococcales bacterium 68-20]|nr:mandelate racemase [Myxococcales bacterium]OJY22291.1 MAG: mandelate racemase [Myxococcales bacterium 68-20]
MTLPRSTLEHAGGRIELLEAEVYVVPTERPESDGTFAWDRTTVIVVRAHGGGCSGIGWTFAHASAAELAMGPLARAVVGVDTSATSEAWSAMSRAVRNIGRPGLGWEAISAVDIALWDLRARILGMPLFRLLAPARESVRAYGSGGFTSYDDDELASQLGRWSDEGFSAVKMKVGRHPNDDLRRVQLARSAVKPEVQLFVDANGAWARKQALAQMEAFASYGVTWVEEPVSSEDISGLRLLRDRAPAGMEISAGEYGYVLADFRRFLSADCLDVVQADITRCGGVTGILAVAALCEAFELPLSTHCAPHLHAHVGCALRPLRHVEYFHDHARIEQLLLDRSLQPRQGELRPDPDVPGLGVAIVPEAARFRVSALR